MGGIGKHGIADLPDPFGGIVPGLVDEVGIGGDGIDLSAYGNELVLDIGQVLQLRGAHESEVRGIEEEHAPLAEDILLGNGPEAVVDIGLSVESADLFVDHRHSIFSFLFDDIWFVIFIDIIQLACANLFSVDPPAAHRVRGG